MRDDGWFCTEWLTQHFNVDKHGWLLDPKEMEDDEEEDVAAAAEAEEQVQERVGGEGGAVGDAGGSDAALLKRARTQCAQQLAAPCWEMSARFWHRRPPRAKFVSTCGPSR